MRRRQILKIFKSSMASLVGPPEIYNHPPAGHGSATVGDPFMDLLAANFNSMTPFPNPQMGCTENGSPTFLSTGNPCLDFFFHIVPDTPAPDLTHRLRLAWEHNPLTALKLICNLRGVRGTGKSDKEGFYTAALWLHKHHPKTLACNVGSLAEFGYFKDLPEILYRLLEGPEVRRIIRQEHARRKVSRPRCFGQRRRFGFRFGGEKQKRSKRRSPALKESKEARVMAATKRAEMEKEAARNLREEKRISKAKKAVQLYSRDPDYQFLHDHVSDHFADCLKSDIQCLNSSEPNQISLAAKWCTSLDSSFDRSTLLCESIARRVFPRDAHPEYEGIEDAYYAYRVRDRLRKQVLVPLRKALELPEVYIGANQWNAIPYNRVASVAMKMYKDKFLKHDKDRFEEYLERVKSGKAKIAAGALLPHEIIAALYEEDGGQVAELQWKRMVGDLSRNGKLNNCLAVCDVSGSMIGIPMEVSVALGILVSELSEDPWKGKLITFSDNPKLQKVEGENLRSKTEFVREMEWGMNTDFQKVFNLILQVAVNGNLREEQMIKRVFVFSDMEFDVASVHPWETDYQAIVRKFTEKGYGSVVPEIVFWNLRNSNATPVPGNQKGVALVSGFLKNLMHVFLEGRTLNPESVMEKAISGEEYQKLVVLD